MPHTNHSSLIFPEIPSLPQIFGAPRPKAEVLRQLKRDPGTWRIFQNFQKPDREAFLGFCMGSRGLKVTYDPFFQHIFNPDLHPGRLDRLLSCILGENVTVKTLRPRERQRISEDSSLLIMDILVQLETGQLVNVEMQRIGYHFPIERAFCYAADLLVRQYDLAKKDRGNAFSYQDIKPIHTIILMEKSPGIFQQHPGHYLHHSCFSFDTGLPLKPLQNLIYISLDIFRRMPHNKNNLSELEAWLYFLASDNPSDILNIVKQYPAFQELYKDIVLFRFQPKEVISMYSEALSIMDRNTVKYMMDEMKAENLRLAEENQRHAEENHKQAKENQRQAEEIRLLKQQLAEYTKTKSNTY